MTVLWEAGQARRAREGRDRIAAAFIAGRDAGMDVLVRSGQAKASGPWREPAYLRPGRDEARRSPELRDRALAQLGAMYPGMVRRHGADS